MNIKVSTMINAYAREARRLIELKAQTKLIQAKYPEFKKLANLEKALKLEKLALIDNGLSVDNSLSSATTTVSLELIDIPAHERRKFTIT